LRVLIDLQMIAGADRAHPWMHLALDSAARADVPARIISNVRTVASARAEGFAASSAEFVGWLDSDDLLIGRHAHDLVQLLRNDPAAVGAFTNERAIDVDGADIGPGATTGAGPWNPVRQLTVNGYGRHLCIFRRAAVLPFLDEIAATPSPELFLIRGLLASAGHWIHHPVDGYAHRRHGANFSAQTKRSALNAITARIAPILMAHAGEVEEPQPEPPCSTCARVRAALGPVGRLMDRLVPL
jgi:hypothetical protein